MLLRGYNRWKKKSIILCDSLGVTPACACAAGDLTVLAKTRAVEYSDRIAHLPFAVAHDAQGKSRTPRIQTPEVYSGTASCSQRLRR